MKRHLDRLVREQDARAHRDVDPVSFVHRFDDPDDQEVVGLLAALLAFGNVVAIRRSVERALTPLLPSPARRLATMRRATLERVLDGCAVYACAQSVYKCLSGPIPCCGCTI